MKPTKIISIVLIAALTIGLVAGVAVFTANEQKKVDAPRLTVNGEEIKDPGTVLTIGGNEVSFEDYRHYFLINKYYLESMMGDPDYYNDDVDGAKSFELRMTTEQALQQQYAWLAYAEENDITLSQEEQDEITGRLQDKKEEQGSSFSAFLADQFLVSEEQYVRIEQDRMLSQKAQQSYTDLVSEQEGDDALAGVVTVKHILFGFDEESEDTEDNQAQTLAMAEEAVEELRGLKGDKLEERFDEMIAEYSSDFGQPEEGYTFGPGTMVDEFYDASLALKEGEVSDPVGTVYGYHVILRLPLNEAYVEENREELSSNSVNTAVNEQVQKLMDSMEVVPGEYYAEISVESIQ